MSGLARKRPTNRLEGLLTRQAARPTRRPRRAEFEELALALIATGIDDSVDVPRSWGAEPVTVPGLEGAEYQYRLGGHDLVLAVRGVTDRQESAVRQGEAEFALVVEGPLMVLGSRFGQAMPWSWTVPYNWHFTDPAERFIPADVPLSPESFARLWGTLWITLVDADDGRVRVRRAVALSPEFTRALHGVLRAQALTPFRGAAADRALDRLRYVAVPSVSRVRAMTRCAAATDTTARDFLTRQLHDSRPRQPDHHLPRALDAYPLHPDSSPPVPRGPGRRRLDRGRGGPPGDPTGPGARPRPGSPGP